jgi:hypothetical protein
MTSKRVYTFDPMKVLNERFIEQFRKLPDNARAAVHDLLFPQAARWEPPERDDRELLREILAHHPCGICHERITLDEPGLSLTINQDFVFYHTDCALREWERHARRRPPD